MRKPELMSLYWMTAGMFPGGREISKRDFEARLKSASKAGFTGIGCWHTDLEHVLVHHTPAEIKMMLDDNGIRHVELEWIGDWFLEGRRKAESDVRKQWLFELNAILGAKHIKVGDFYNSKVEMPKLIDSFGALCRDAAPYGATIGFEFMASSMIHTLEECRAMVEGAAPKNGGLIIDIAHVVALGMSYESVSKVPGRYVTCVELNDNLLPGTVGRDPGERRFCGEGEFDIGGFIAAIDKTGYAGPWAVEVFSHPIADLPLDEQNRRAFETTMAQFG
jgi:sugar phosphate isomerase/epimerase